jgi:hypothetical protein
MKNIVLSVLLCSLSSVAHASTTQVLVIASSTPFDEVSGVKGVEGETLLREVKKYLSKDLKMRGKMKLSRKDIYATKKLDTAYGGKGGLVDTTYHCHSLAQWYFWPEGREERMADLKGEGKTKWDVVVLVGDPYVIKNMPGVYAEGVQLLTDAIRLSKAKPVLFMSWGSSSSKLVSSLGEVVCRVAEGADVVALPQKVVKANARKIKGPYEGNNPFAMKHEFNREILYNHTGSSSERGIEKALHKVFQRCVVSGRKTNQKEGSVDFNYGRANSNFEPNKQYKVNPKLYGRSYGFPMQDHSKSADVSMLFGLDKRMFGGSRYEDGTDLGIAWDMIRQEEVEKDIRCLPIRLLWAKIKEAVPEQKPFGDRWHMNKILDDATATFLYTLQSGRCAVGEEPADKKGDAFLSWTAQRIGYETAWTMSQLTARAPGLTVRPEKGSQSLASGSSTDLKVRFQYVPNEDVVVQIKAPKGTKVYPESLTFTKANYSEAQSVSFSVGDQKPKSKLALAFVTSSEDAVYDQLKDEWVYAVKE